MRRLLEGTGTQNCRKLRNTLHWKDRCCVPTPSYRPPLAEGYSPEDINSLPCWARVCRLRMLPGLQRKLCNRRVETLLPRGATKYKMPSSVQFNSVAQSCPTLCDPMNRSTPGLPVHHQLPEFAQTHVHRVRDAIQPSHPQSSPSPPAPNPSQHQSLFQ